MADDSDPPRRFYQLKPKDFERVNEVPALPTSRDSTVADSGPTAGTPAPDRRIELRELVRQASAGAPLLRGNHPANHPNEVHAMLRDNLAAEQAAGLHELKPLPPKRSRRRRDFWVLVIGTNSLIAVVYAVQVLVGFQVMCLATRMPAQFGNLVLFALDHPASYILAIAGMAFFTVAWWWLLFGVMDDY